MIDANQVVTCLGNIPWLSDLPSRWKVVRSKRLFTVRKQRAFPDDEQLSATQAYGVISQAEYEKKIGRKVVRITQHLDKRAHVEKDDFVISMRSFQGGLERAWTRGCIRSSYVVLQPAPDVHINFFAHLFKSHDYIRALQATSNFIRDGQDLNFRNFSLVDLPLPPMEEQIAIGRFLDHADRRIRRYIRAKRQLIALLNEQKQAIIHHAVTRGLDPHVKLKPSGIEWLGDVPEHWEIWQIGHFARVGNGSTPSRGNAAYWSVGIIPWLNSSSVNDSTIEAAQQFVTPTALSECHLPIVKSGSVLVAITGQGKTRGMAARLLIESTINQHVAYITPSRPMVTQDFLFLALKGAYAELRRISDDAGSTKGALTCGDLKHFRLALPPVSEQMAIFNAVDQDTSDSKQFATQLEDEIKLVTEYRTRLIADVVTGKLDVREAAAALPDELEGVGAEPDAEELLDEDDTTDHIELDTEPEEVEA